MIVHACHCRLCQVQTGTTNVVNALIEAERVVLLKGEVAEHTLPTPSGKGQRISRCPSCRTALWSNYLINGQGELVRFIRVGTLDTPELMPPDVHIFTGSKVPWYVIPEQQPAVDPFYDFDTTWPQASKDRIAAVTARTGVRYR